MKDADTVKFLKTLGATVPHSQQRTGWIVSDCPMGPWRHENGHSNPTAFGVQREQGDAFCHCWSCGWHGSQSDLILDMKMRNKVAHRVECEWGEAQKLVDAAAYDEVTFEDGPDISEVILGKKGDLHVYPDWWLESFPTTRSTPWAQSYLDQREVSPDLASWFDLRADPAQRRVCFPVRDFTGRLVGLHGRAIEKGVEPRYRMYTQAGQNNPIVWLGESWLDQTLPMVVVEGPFDVASVKRVYRNVVSPLFALPNVEKIKRMIGVLEWVTLLDAGKAGDQGRLRYSKTLTADHILTQLQPPAHRKDPGEMSVDELREVLADHVPLD